LQNDNLIEIERLAFSYGERSILNNINLTAKRGQVVAIMGGSGCGKTTLLRLIGGQIKPSRGVVRVAGESVSELDRDGCVVCGEKWACCSSLARCSLT